MNSYPSSEQLTKIQQNRYILYFFIAIFFILPMVMVTVDVPLIKAAYYTRKESLSTNAKIVHVSEYQKQTTGGGKTYDIEYAFEIPDQNREFTGKDRVESSFVPSGVYKIRYNPSNPSLNRLENPYYTSSKLYATLALFVLSIFSTILAFYSVYTLTFPRARVWLLTFSYISLVVLAGLMAYHVI